MTTKTPFRRDNHYVARGYLKRFAASDGQVATYRILVSHPKVPLWKKNSTRGIAYHSHLYTRLVAGHESDEIEEWLAREFEAPAEEALHKATSDARLTPRDWNRLIRYLAAQDVRTPARFLESLKRWDSDLPQIIENSIRKSVRKLERAKHSGETIVKEGRAKYDHVPLRVTTEIKPGEKVGMVKGETLAGRGLWLFEIQNLLSGRALKVLEGHKWSILKPPPGLIWFTSDNPVVRLNFDDVKNYNFGGGWGSKGTEILLPLSPQHLLYTQIGHPPPPRGEVMPRHQAEIARRALAENAHRLIFATSPDDEVPMLRPRTVSAALFRNETEQWRRWNEEQTAAERELMDT